MLGLESMAEDSVTQEYHPASTGFIMKKMTKENPELINPIYFGTQNMKLPEGKSGAGVKLGQNYKNFKNTRTSHNNTTQELQHKNYKNAIHSANQSNLPSNIHQDSEGNLRL